MKKTLFLLIPTLLLSCGPYLLHSNKVPRVLEVDPRDLLLPGEAVQVSFSLAMDRVSVDSALSLEGPEGQIAVRLDWRSDRELLLSPLERELSAGPEYRLEISTLARSEEGVPLRHAELFRFTSSQDTEAPEVVAVTPDPETQIFSDGGFDIEIRFSEPMDRDSLYHAFSISPSIETQLTWQEDDSLLRIHGQGDGSESVDYRLDLSRECSDRAGNPLAKNRSWLLRTSPPQLPELERILFSSDYGTRSMEPQENTTYQVDRDEEIRLVFSAEVPEVYRETLVTLLPTLEYHLQWRSIDSGRQELIIDFAEPLQWAKSYALEVGTQTFILDCSGERSMPLELEAVAFCNDVDAAEPVYRLLEPNDVLSLNASEKASVELLFHHSPYSSLSELSFMEHFSLSASNGSALLTPLAVTKLDTAGHHGFSTEPGYTVLAYYFTVEPQDAPGLLELEVSGEMKDSLGNSLAQPVELSYNL